MFPSPLKPEDETAEGFAFGVGAGCERLKAEEL
jgi:hypothetical protein